MSFKVFPVTFFKYLSCQLGKGSNRIDVFVYVLIGKGGVYNTMNLVWTAFCH